MSDVLAVIATGGKQMLVRPGDTMRVEKLDGEPSAAVTFPDVLLFARGEEGRVGHPTVSGAVVTGTIVKHGRHDKVIGIKFKAKKRYRKKFGHRQRLTEVEIVSI